jgi:hypothetical protein
VTEPSWETAASCRGQHDESLPLQPTDRLPFSVRVVAWAFLVTGVSSLVDAILQLFVIHHDPALNLHIVAIFIGRGLLRRREGWLRFARGYNALLLIVLIAAMIVSVGFYLFVLAGFVDGTNVTWSAPPGLAFPWLLGVSAYLVWQQRVLSRPDVRDLFRRAAEARSTQPARRFQFSLGTLLMLAVLVAVVLPQVTDVDVLYRRHVGLTALRIDSAGRQWTISFGYRSHRFLSKPDELDYVVFVSDQGQGACRVTSWSSSGGKTGTTLEMPDGTTIALDGDYRLIEYNDGRYRESRERVTKGQFDAFLASEPAAYTIDALLEYAKTHPERGSAN